MAFGRAFAGPREDAEPVNLRAKAVAFLARREHSRAELYAKLLRFSSDQGAIDSLLEALARENLLSDRRAAESMVRVRSARHGAVKVAGELRSKGIPEEIAQGLLRELAGTEEERARALWQRKFGGSAADATGRAKQMRFLQARGFSNSVIRLVVPPVGKSAVVDD